jgi:hypothetical protein
LGLSRQGSSKASLPLDSDETMALVRGNLGLKRRLPGADRLAAAPFTILASLALTA